MPSMHEQIKIFAKYAKIENKLIEKLVKPGKEFKRNKDQLITIIGRC